MICPIIEHPRAKEVKTRLPLKKRKLRDNFDLKSNKPWPDMKSRHQVAIMNPTTGNPPSFSGTSIMEAITQEINELLIFGVDKAKRKKLLNEKKNRWRTRLGMSEVHFSNGLWLLARNKANIQFQLEKRKILNTDKVVDQQTDSQNFIFTDITNSSNPRNSAVPVTIDDTKGPRIYPTIHQQDSWSNLFHSDIWTLGPQFLRGYVFYSHEVNQKE